MLQVFYLNVAYVFTIVSSVFLGVMASVSDPCFKRFFCLQTYVANVASRCFKNRSGVASPFSPSTTSPWCLLLLLLPASVGHLN
jgi:hypothetical protein